MFSVVSPFTVKRFATIEPAIAECLKLTVSMGEAIGLFNRMKLIAMFHPNRREEPMTRIAPKKPNGGRRMLGVVLLILMAGQTVAAEPVVTTFPDGWKITITPGESSYDGLDPWSGLGSYAPSYGSSQDAIVRQAMDYNVKMEKARAAGRTIYRSRSNIVFPITPFSSTIRIR